MRKETVKEMKRIVRKDKGNNFDRKTLKIAKNVTNRSPKLSKRKK